MPSAPPPTHPTHPSAVRVHGCFHGLAPVRAGATTRIPLCVVRLLASRYYEGKEFEVKMKEKTPGQLSDALRAALGMTEATSPPPWLVNMQRSVRRPRSWG